MCANFSAITAMGVVYKMTVQSFNIVNLISTQNNKSFSTNQWWPSNLDHFNKIHYSSPITCRDHYSLMWFFINYTCSLYIHVIIKFANKSNTNV